MKNILLIGSLVIVSLIKSQNIMPSSTYVRTCISDIECASINSSSYLFYDDVKSKFYIMIDFNKLKTGVDSVDFWLEDLNDTYFYYKAPLMKEQLPSLTSYNRKTIRLTGESFLNNIWRSQTIDMTVFRAEDNMMTNTTNGIDYAAYKINLNFTISPPDFNIHKKPQKLTNMIYIGVGSGQLNLLQPGSESLLGEAYNHE